MLKRQRKSKYIILYSIHTHKKTKWRDTDGQTDKHRHPHRQSAATKTLFCHERINLTRQHAAKLNKDTAPSPFPSGNPDV